MSADISQKPTSRFYVRHQYIHVVPSGQECLAFDGSVGSCHILNETAGWLLSLAERPVEVGEAVRLSRERYEIAEAADLAREIDRGLEEMRGLGLLEIHEASEGP